MNERRRFAPEEKMKIVLEGLSGTIEISELCRKHRITTTMFYVWKEKLLENSATVFNDRRGRKSSTERKTEELKEEVVRLKDTIAEITTENLALKKKIGNYGVVYYASGAMSAFKDGEGIIAAEVISASNVIVQKQARLMSEFMSNYENPTLIVGDRTSLPLKEKVVAIAKQLSYSDLYAIRTADIASELNVSHRTAQRLINSVLKERIVFAYPIINQSVIKKFNTAIVFAQIESSPENPEIFEKLSLVEPIFEKYLLIRIVDGMLSMLIYYDTQGELDECVKGLQRIFRNFSVITRFETYFNEELEKGTIDKFASAQPA